MKAIFFSDAHLLDNDADRINTIKRFLGDVAKDADMVFVLGDLFEFYHDHKGYIYPFYKEIVDFLRDLAARTTVYFIEGNHEFGMGQFFESYTGITCLRSLTINMDGYKVFLSHGDELGSLRLRRILKSRFIYAIMDLLRPTLTWRIAMLCRPFLSRRHKGYDRKVLMRFRAYGKNRLQEGYDAVITAHSHMADIEEYDLNGQKKVYLNTGDFIASYTYVAYNSGKGFSLNTYNRRLL